MKPKIVLILLGAFLQSCVFMRQPYVLTSTSIDYTSYSEKGFFITEANSVSFDYKPIASVSSTFLSGYELKKVDGNIVYETDYNGLKYPVTTKEYVYATEKGAMDELYRKCKELGANGLIGFKIIENTSWSKEGRITQTGYTASGMAIKY